MTHFVQKLSLGTAQFGSNYGISNQYGRPKEIEAYEILKIAHDIGIKYIDTAPAYGESEQIIGRFMGEIVKNYFSIFTKLSKFEHETIRKNDIINIKKSFYSSLENLNAQSIHGVLIHDASVLKSRGIENLINFLTDLKHQKLIQSIGISIYDMDEIPIILNTMPCNVIQMPFNILDQRPIQGGIFSKLHSLDIKIQVRSIFLQGLLLMPLDKIPIAFLEIIPTLKKIHEIADHFQCSLLECALHFVANFSEVHTILIGVNKPHELYELYEACQKRMNHDLLKALKEMSVDDIKMIDPRQWK